MTYLGQDNKVPPERNVHHKEPHIKKFLGAVARLRYNATRDISFDNKIGIWSFVKQVPATRRLVLKKKGVIAISTSSVKSSTITTS